MVGEYEPRHGTDLIAWKLFNIMMTWSLGLYSVTILNSLPNLQTKFADDKIYVTVKLKFIFRSVENFMGKEENAGYQHFLLFP